MKLSVIIPVYNSEQYISECLDSILKKNNNNFEIIIINDGSTDNSASLCNEYASNFKNVKLFNIDNHGVSYARNYGVKKASGEYITFVDSDDCLLENWQDLLLKEKYSEDIIYINKKIRNTSNKDYLIKCILGLNSSQETIAGPFSKLFKADFLKNNNICFDKTVINGEDMLFNVESLLKAKTLRVVNETFYLYRINPNSVTNKFNEKIIKSDFNFQNSLKELLGDSQKFKKYIDNKKINGVITICKFISYLKDYGEAKKYFKQIYINFYIEKINYNVAELNKKQKYMYKLFLKKRFLIIFYINKILNYSRFKKMKKETYFINI